MDKKKEARMVQHEGYYDYMLRRSREENMKNKNHQSIATMMRNEIIEMQKTIHALQIRVKELREKNDRLEAENANIHDN